MPEMRLTKKLIELLPYPPAGQVLFNTLARFPLRIISDKRAYSSD